MKLYIITGTSSGIGKAMALRLLQDPSVWVIGMSRRVAIEHDRYTHMRVELSKLAALENVEFPIKGNEEEVVLINNAGWIGEIAPMGKLDHLAIEENYNINLVAPTMLINQFLIQTANLETRKVIVNISSGAGKYPIKSWGAYCASKAGIDMITRVINEEHPDVEAYAIAPGIVNTRMQQDVREAKPELFDDRDRFVSYFEKGELASADDVAAKLIYLITHPNEIPEKVFSLRDVK